MLHASSLQFLGPAGRWTLFRLGCSVLPVHLHPAKRARPVSCDHLQQAHDHRLDRGGKGQIRGDTDWKYRSPRACSLAGRVEKLAPRVEREVPGLIAATTVEHNFGVWCGRLGISTFRSDTGRAEVGSVKSCSKAESYGMQVGDTVLELDGQRGRLESSPLGS